MKYSMLIGAAALLVAGCNGPQGQYSDQVSHNADWQHEESVTDSYRDYEQLYGGYYGSLTCHTSDGGCLHITCMTKGSCDYMAEQQKKRCATPTSKVMLMCDTPTSTSTGYSFTSGN